MYCLCRCVETPVRLWLQPKPLYFYRLLPVLWQLIFTQWNWFYYDWFFRLEPAMIDQTRLEPRLNGCFQWRLRRKKRFSVSEKEKSYPKTQTLVEQKTARGTPTTLFQENWGIVKRIDQLIASFWYLQIILSLHKSWKWQIFILSEVVTAPEKQLHHIPFCPKC